MKDMKHMKHTPTPWLVRDHIVLAKYSDESRLDPNMHFETPICTMSMPNDCRDISHGMQETGANAEFIVRACNAHEELLAVVRMVIEWGDDPMAADSGSRKRFYLAAKAAIAAMEGRDV